MKKLIMVVTGIILAITMLCCMSGCSFEGYDLLDTNYHFDKAIIRMPDDSVKEIELASWADAEDGEQLTLTAKDGTRYLVSANNCILIENNKGE